MQNGEYLLDTNIIIAFLNNEYEVLKQFRQISMVYLSVIVLGELEFGARCSARKVENLEKIYKLASYSHIIHIDRTTCRFYSEIKAQLRRSGTPIPENDIWLAASSQQYNLPLVTRDTHFDEIESLVFHRW